MRKKLFLFLLIIIQCNIFSQPEFGISVKDYFWQNASRNNVNLVILLSIKNKGTEAGADDELNVLYLTCSQKSYQYGKDITFVKFNNSINQVIQPGEEKLGYMIFNVPKDADGLKLKFPENIGGAEKDICMSYVNWGYYNRDASIFVDEAHKFIDSREYASALTSYLKAYSVNPYLKLSSEIDSTFDLFTQSEESETYLELFSDILARQKDVSDNLNPTDSKPVKLKGELYFVKEYKNGQEVERSDAFYIRSGGGHLTVMIKFNRRVDIDKITLKIVKIGLLFDIPVSETVYEINPDMDSFYIPDIGFSTAGTYKVTAYHSNGRKIASNTVKLVLMQ
ncbi:MAG: DUF4352 domain-containing protein [Ignavibacteriae bacterium]|nr:MAG: DUF4352 domain-containing protein [Ignavibacteriota bacterium]